MHTSATLRISVLALLCTIGILDVPSAGAATIQVKAGDNLQAAINAAAPGDTLLLDPGVTYTGNFVLPVKSGAAFITIRTAGSAGLPGDGSRISPSHAPLLAKIRSSNAGAAIRTAPGAHHWRLLLLELPSTMQGYGDILQIGDGSSVQNLASMVPHTIELDRLYIHGDPLMGQKRGVALNAANVTIRNCYIADIKAIGIDTQAIGGWNGPGPFLIENNYLEASGENLLLGGADPAIANLVSENVVVRHNYMSRPLSWRDPVVPAPGNVSAGAGTGGSLAAGTYGYRVVARRRVGGGVIARSTASAEATVTLVNGGAARISWTAVPDALEYYVYGRGMNWTATGTSFTDTGAGGRGGAAPTSIGDRWLVKNLFELKNARNVVVENNIFENNWAHGQVGYAILFTPRNQDGACTWCVVENVTFHSNVVRNAGGGINILGYDNLAPSRQTANIRITQNLFYGIDKSYGGSGWFLLIGDEPRDVTVDHNTVDATANALLYVYGGTATAPRAVQGFAFTNNAIRHNDYGINGTNFSFGTGILSNYFPAAVVRGNWIQAGYASRYPAGNYFGGTFESGFLDVAGRNYTAVPGGVLAGQATDGSDIGANITALGRALRYVEEGIPAGPRPPTNLRIVTR